MKKHLIIAVIACFFFISCEKTDDTLPPEPIKEYLKGKLNGIAFNYTKANIVTLSDGLVIGGFDPYGSISLIIRPYTNLTGEIQLKDDNSIGISKNPGFFTAGFVNGKIQGSGKINILEITSSFIRGSFECTAPADSFFNIYPTQFISEGEFKVKKP
jgi:hypothetical protein